MMLRISVSASDVGTIATAPHDSRTCDWRPQFKLVPVIVTSVPAVPVSGETDVMLGAAQTDPHVQSGRHRPGHSASSGGSHSSLSWFTMPSPQRFGTVVVVLVVVAVELTGRVLLVVDVELGGSFVDGTHSSSSLTVSNTSGPN